MTEPETEANTAAPADAPRRPVRIVHIGLRRFFRAHQAWYTHNATDAAGWGIAAFTVRSPRAATELAAQGLSYPLTVRGPDGDTEEWIDSVVAAHDGVCVTIETDTTLSRTSLRESLRARPETLRRLGWHYVRVHAFQLFTDPDAVASRVAEVLGIEGSRTTEIPSVPASQHVNRG